MPSSGPFNAIFVPDALAEALSDRAWIQALLSFEAALASAEGRVGVIPSQAAERIAAVCRSDDFDAEAIAHAGRDAGNPAAPLVAELRERVGGGAARYVHWGATSQDAVDTAAMLVARRTLDLILADLEAVVSRCASIAKDQRATLVVGRTLLQQAVPTTFGLKAAGWLVGCIEARRPLVAARDGGLAAQLGGAVGTLASLGDEGLNVLAQLSAELALAEPVVPWHTSRARVAELAAALGVACGALLKLSQDLILLCQTEVAEVSQPAGGGRGGSSTMPHKRNPVEAVRACACARRAPGLCVTLLSAMGQEHERAAGAWHSEWQAFCELLAATGGAAAWTLEALESVEIEPDRMRENLDKSKGLVLAERVRMAVAERTDAPDAQAAVTEACLRAAGRGASLREELLRQPQVAAVLGADDLDAVLDPASYLGSANAFIERALSLYASEVAAG